MRVFQSYLIVTSILLAPATLPAQTVATAKVLGTVASVDAGSKKLQVKDAAGATWSVDVADRAVIERVAPGEKDLSKATHINLADIAAGDKVRARGTPGTDPNSLTALSLIVMTRADLAQKQAHDQAEWARRGISGLVTAVDAGANQVTINVRSAAGPRPVVVQAAPNAVIRRYAQDSVKFADAKPSTLAAISVGDQVRALGDRSEDGTHFTAEEIVSGSFRTIAATVISTDPAANTVTAQNLENKQEFTIHTNADTLMRRIPPEVATMLAVRMRGMTAAPGATAGASSGTPAPGGAAAGSGGPQGVAHPGGWQGGAGGGRAGRGDLQQMLERMPPLNLADLKKGDALIISSSSSADSSNVTAINLIAGVEPFLAAAPRGARGQYNLGNWNLDMGGGMPGE